MNTKKLKNLIEKNLSSKTQVIVESEDNFHFSTVVISDLFNNNMSKINQQKMIYSIINKYILSGEIHAIKMKTYSINEWNLLRKA